MFDKENAEQRTRFNELAARVTALNLYVTDEAGERIRKYGSQT